MGPIQSFADLPANDAFHDRYAQRSLLGSGGAGEVHLYADDWIGREVALKVLREAPDDDGARPLAQRFFREARLQGQLEHPAVVPVYDLGVAPNGCPFFTMKRVRGLTLTDVLEQTRRAIDSGAPRQYGQRRLLEAFVRVCLAVDFAHARGVVHRDLKPSNIMLGDFGEVYLLDWGVAKVMDIADPSATEPLGTSLPRIGATDVGSWMGTPGYMAPEQINAGKVGPRTDVYALGTILFEVLTTRTLHPIQSPVQAISSTRQGVEARPSMRTPELHVPPEFDAVLARATAVDPDERYPSARALAEAVEHYLDGHRDLELRREIAAGYAARAAQAVAELAEGAADEAALQRTALRNVGRTLALDPSHPEATKLLEQLMLREPRDEPEEVQRAAGETQRQLRKKATDFLFWRSVLWAVCVPLTLWAGYTRPLIAGAAAAGIVATLALLAVLRRRESISDRVGLLLLCVTTVLFAGFSVLFGPFIVVPSVVATNSIFFVLHSRPGQRLYIILAGVLAVMVPFLAELLQLVPPSYTFEAGRMVVEPRVMALEPISTMGILALLHIMLAIAPTVIAVRVRDELLAAERKLSLTGWRLGHLATDLSEGIVGPHSRRYSVGASPSKPGE